MVPICAGMPKVGLRVAVSPPVSSKNDGSAAFLSRSALSCTLQYEDFVWLNSNNEEAVSTQAHAILGSGATNILSQGSLFRNTAHIGQNLPQCLIR